MEWIALDTRALDRLIHERQVKCRVVANKDGALTVVFPDSTANRTKQALQRIPFSDSRSQRVVRVNPVDGQRCGLHVGTLKRLDVIADGLTACQDAAVAKIDKHCSNLKQRVCFRIEAAGFHIDDNGQEAAKAARH